MLIDFRSDEFVEGAGFALEWQQYQPPPDAACIPATGGRCDAKQPCRGVVQLTASAGTFSDGSYEQPYELGASCAWVLIQPAEAITVVFTELELELGHDFVKVYRARPGCCALNASFSARELTQSLELIGSFSGSPEPCAAANAQGTGTRNSIAPEPCIPFSVTAPALVVEFSSDTLQPSARKGFSAVYRVASPLTLPPTMPRSGSPTFSPRPPATGYPSICEHRSSCSLTSRTLSHNRH
jgi:hypothetical protein